MYFLIDGDTFLPAPQEAAGNTYLLPKTTLKTLVVFSEGAWLPSNLGLQLSSLEKEDTQLPSAALFLSLVPFLVFRSWNCSEESSQVPVKQNFLLLPRLKFHHLFA